MINIRYGCFETNSSGTHCISICMKSDYKAWERGEKYYNENSDVFYSHEDMLLKVRKYYNKNKDSLEKYYPELKDVINSDNELLKYIKNDAHDLNNIVGYIDYESFYNDVDEEFYKEFITPSGDEVVMFGYYMGG